MRTLVLGVAAALAATTLAPLSTSAASTQCLGQTVTIFAGPGENVTGTAGDDVIDVYGARSVHALGGNDRVCVTRLIGDQDLFIYAGDGADRVRVHSKNRRARLNAWFDDAGGDVFRGGPADEWVIGPSLVRAALRAGDDQLLVTDRKYRPDDAPGQAAPYTGGPGRDRIVVGVVQDDISTDERISGNLRRGTLVSRNGGVVTDVVRMRLFEDLRAYGEVVNLRGDGRANSLQAYGCTVRMVGGGGADVLAQPRRFDIPHGCRSGMTMKGGPGADRLTGRAGNDRLIGGPGRDLAVGNDGRDVCRTEVRRECERR